MNTEQLDQSHQRTSLVEMLRREKVRHVMLTEPVVIEPSANTRDVVEQMKQRTEGCALVCEAGSLKGIFTERDYLDKIAGSNERLAEPVLTHMSPEPVVLGPDDSIGDLVRIISSGGYRHLPVVEDGAVCGLVTALDIVKYIADLFPSEVYNLPPDMDQIMSRSEGA